MNSMFSKVTQSDETILFEGGVNKAAFILSSIFRNIFLSAFLSVFPAQIYFLASMGITNAEPTFKMWALGWIVSYAGLNLLFLLMNILASNNTALCITNERIVIRNGSFSQRYVYYSLKNIGMVALNSGMFDSKGDYGSATLTFATKIFHIDKEGQQQQHTAAIAHLNNAYEAYKILMDLTEGENEALKVQIQK